MVTRYVASLSYQWCTVNQLSAWEKGKWQYYDSGKTWFVHPLVLTLLNNPTAHLGFREGAFGLLWCRKQWYIGCPAVHSGSLKETLNTKISLHRIQERLYFWEINAFWLSIQDFVMKAENKQCALISNQSRERLFQRRKIIIISINQSESPPLNPNHFLDFSFNPLQALRCGEKASLARESRVF